MHVVLDDPAGNSYMQVCYIYDFGAMCIILYFIIIVVFVVCCCHCIELECPWPRP